MDALLYILAAFGFILFLAWVRVPLMLAILSGTLLMGILFDLTISETIGAMLSGVIQPRAIGLFIITVLLLSLSGMMQRTGQFEKIVGFARAILRRPAFAMAALPALVGLLPMPGGALFSAPMVKTAADNNKTQAGMLSAINYWYRHIWEHWWPLYPGVILAVSLSGLDYSRFLVLQLPLGVFMAVCGLWVFKGSHPDIHKTTGEPAKGVKIKFIKATSPIWIILLVWAAVRFMGGLIFQQGDSETSQILLRYAPLGIGLIIAVLWSGIIGKAGREDFVKVWCRKKVFAMGALVMTVMVFQHMLTRLNAAEQVAEGLEMIKIHPVVITAFLPFVAGMVTGLAIGFVGTSFPIILSIVSALPGESILPYIALGYGFGHLGQMISPLHLCYIVSNKYFETGFGSVYKHIIPAVVTDGILVMGYFLLLNNIIL